MVRKSLLEELSVSNTTDKYKIVEAKADRAITMAINVINYIEEQFTAEESTELKNRIINSIKGKDNKKFLRKINELNKRK